MLTQAMPDLARRMADCTMAREGLLLKGWHYDSAVVWRGMEAVYALTGDKRYYDYIKDAVDHFVTAEGNISGYRMEDYNLDSVCAGRQLLFLYRETGEEKYMKAAALLREQLRDHPRNEDGGFWHKKCYPHQMWLDGLHMAMPFYAEYALMSSEEEILADVTRQFRLAYRHTYDPVSGLNRHACDAARAQSWASPETGQSAHAWGRAMGWYLLGLIDTLEILKRYERTDGELEAIYVKMAEKLMSIRENGVWMQVLDCPKRPGNYAESSATFLILAAVMKGAELGLLNEGTAKEARASYEAAVTQFVGQMKNGSLFVGKCCQVAGLGGNIVYRDGSFDYYMSEPVTAYDLKATGAMLQAACAMERWEKGRAK